MGCLKGGRNLDFPVTPIDHMQDSLRDTERIDEIRRRGNRAISPADLLVQMFINREAVKICNVQPTFRPFSALPADYLHLVNPKSGFFFVTSFVDEK